MRLFVVLEFIDGGPTHVEQMDVLAAIAAVGALDLQPTRDHHGDHRPPGRAVRPHARRPRAAHRGGTGGRGRARRVRPGARRCPGLTSRSTGGSPSWRPSTSRRPPNSPAQYPRTRSTACSNASRASSWRACSCTPSRPEPSQLADNWVDLVAAQHSDAMAQALRLEQAALAASEVLEAAGVRHVLLKGAALATAVYPDPSRRPFGDVDLLLEPARFVEGIAALRAAGAVRWLPEVRRGFDRRFAKDVPVLFGGGAIDLHRTLIAGPYGRRIPVGELVERRRDVIIGGRAMSMLDPADAYVHAGLTAGAADVPARLITLRDLLELEARPEFDADAVLGRVRVLGRRGARRPGGEAGRGPAASRPPAGAGRLGPALRRRPGATASSCAATRAQPAATAASWSRWRSCRSGGTEPRCSTP